MNSGVQVLLNTPEVVERLHPQSAKSVQVSKAANTTVQGVYNAMRTLAGEYWFVSRGKEVEVSVLHTVVKPAIGKCQSIYAGDKQQDAQEFLSHLLEVSHLAMPPLGL